MNNEQSYLYINSIAAIPVHAHVETDIFLDKDNIEADYFSCSRSINKKMILKNLAWRVVQTGSVSGLLTKCRKTF